MGLLQALVLGIVQGLTEFLPVSSSAHLQLVPFIVGWEEPSVAFDVAVHIGTLAAVVWVFRGDLARLFDTVRNWSGAPDDERRLVRLVAVGTLPAVIVGAVLRGPLESVFERPVMIALLLLVTGYFLLSTETLVEARDTPPKPADELDTRHALVIGGAQALAILPGISRSGATIVAGMRLGFDRPTAARFSFLLSIPIVAGAALAKLPDMIDQGVSGDGLAMLIGVAASAVSGFYAIRWFLALVQRSSLRPFGWYCVLLMVAGLLTALARA